MSASGSPPVEELVLLGFGLVLIVVGSAMLGWSELWSLVVVGVAGLCIGVALVLQRGRSGG